MRPRSVRRWISSDGATIEQQASLDHTAKAGSRAREFHASVMIDPIIFIDLRSRQVMLQVLYNADDLIASSQMHRPSSLSSIQWREVEFWQANRGFPFHRFLFNHSPSMFSSNHPSYAQTILHNIVPLCCGPNCHDWTFPMRVMKSAKHAQISWLEARDTTHQFWPALRLMRHSISFHISHAHLESDRQTCGRCPNRRDLDSFASRYRCSPYKSRRQTIR